MKFRYLKGPQVKALIRESGKLAGGEFLLALDAHLANRVRAACAVHNGGRRKLDAVVAGYVGIK